MSIFSLFYCRLSTIAILLLLAAKFMHTYTIDPLYNNYGMATIISAVEEALNIAIYGTFRFSLNRNTPKVN
jgi:hypothetical protein